MADNDAPEVWPVLTLQGTRLAGIMERGLLNIAFHTKYKSSGPRAFREEDFFLRFFPIISLWRPMTPGRGQLGPQGHDWQDL